MEGVLFCLPSMHLSLCYLVEIYKVSRIFILAGIPSGAFYSKSRVLFSVLKDIEKKVQTGFGLHLWSFWHCTFSEKFHNFLKNIYIKHVSVKSVNKYCRQLTANPLIRELIIILGTVTFSSKINMDISFWILKCIICELKN